MIIKEINISEFGGLKNVRISPDERMNIIYGENESGKSTVLLFIKFMLYGLGRKSAANSDRERSISWQGHVAAGSLTFSHGGRDYRIERRFTEGTRGGSENLSIIRLDDGTKINTDKTPGEYFLGVPKEVFESSACVGQMRSAEINGERTAASIRNMLTSADENVDTAKILKKLDALRVEYLHKNQSGGSLYEASRHIAEQKQRLEKAREATLSIDGAREKLEAARRDYARVKEELAQRDAIITDINKVNIIRRFEALKRSECEQRELEEAKLSLKSEELKTEFFPDNRHVERLRLSAAQLCAAEEERERKSVLLSEAGVKSYDAELAALGEKIESAGGPDTVIRSVKEKRSISKKQNALIAGAWISEAIFCVAGAMLLLSGFSWGAAFFSWTAFAVILTAKGARVKRAMKAEIADICAEYGTNESGLSQRLALCLENMTRSRSQNSQLLRLRAELEEAGRSVEFILNRTAELLKATLPEAECRSALIYAECDRLEVFLSKYEALCRRQEDLTRFVEAERKALEPYNEQELRDAISIDPDEITPAVIAEAEKMKNFLIGKRNAFEQRVNNLYASLIQLEASAEDPLPIADSIAELEDKYAKDKSFYDALTLAMDSIEKAGKTMQGSVTPAISEYASKILERVTDKRYDTMRANGSLDISLDLDGFSVRSESLSGGTRDLAYLALRISLFMRIYTQGLPPMIFDEALSQLDSKRAERMLTLLGELSGDGMQIILFTCHSREEEICDRLCMEYNKISI